MNIYNDYEQFRETVKSGDVVFVHGSKRGFHPLQRLIMWATGSQFTHVGVAFWAQLDGENSPRLMVVESQGGTHRRLLNLSYYKESDLSVILAPRPWEHVSSAALERVGKMKYGYLDAIWVGIRERLQITFNWSLPKFNFSGETCSEFTAKLYLLEETVVSPQTLYEELIKLNHPVVSKLVNE